VYNDENKKEISRRILNLLDDRHISVSEFSRQLGVPQSTVSAWKNRGALPSADLIPHICANLGVSIEWLLTGEEPKATASGKQTGNIQDSAVVAGANIQNSEVSVQKSNPPISKEAAELLRLYDDLDIKKRIKLLQTMVELSEDEDKT
jgi:transcriptional regulator with XRE-family HTH domain